MSDPEIAIEAHEKYGLPFGFVPDGTVLLTGGFDGSVASWSMPDGEWLAVGGADGTVRIYDRPG